MQANNRATIVPTAFCYHEAPAGKQSILFFPPADMSTVTVTSHAQLTPVTILFYA